MPRPRMYERVELVLGDCPHKYPWRTYPLPRTERQALPSAPACLTADPRCGLLHLGACPALPSGRGERGAARCEASGPEKPEAYSLEYVEDFFGSRTTQMVTDRSPQ